VAIFHNFLTADTIRFQVYDDCRDIYVKSLELLYQGQSAHCKTKFREYLTTRVLGKGPGPTGDSTPTSDNSLKKFYKGLITKFSEDSPSVYSQSNITDILAQL
jgi:hypothetical protein